jgi:hypothetical protein
MNASANETGPKDPREYALHLVREALADLDSGNVLLSAVVRKAGRIARIRQDFEDLFWLEFESLDLKSPKTAKPVGDEIRPHFTRTEWNELGARVLSQHDAERTVATDIPIMKITAGDTLNYTVEGFETRLHTAREQRQKLEEDPDRELEVFDVAATRSRACWCAALQMYEIEASAALGRIRRNVHAYLSRCESELVDGRPYSQTFDRLRLHVEANLSDRAPGVVNELRAALERCEDGTPESNAQAMLACRRALKALADCLYPATNADVKGPDGVSRKMTDDKYVNRLWQWIHERVRDGHYRASIQAGLTDVGTRLEVIYDLASKGVHATTSPAEARSCVMQTVLVVADFVIATEEPSEKGVQET